MAGCQHLMMWTVATSHYHYVHYVIRDAQYAVFGNDRCQNIPRLVGCGELANWLPNNRISNSLTICSIESGGYPDSAMYMCVDKFDAAALGKTEDSAERTDEQLSLASTAMAKVSRGNGSFRR
jgi:hypothetical protein